MLNTLYTLSFITSFIYLFIILSVFRNRIPSFYIMLFATIMITNFGYMQMSDSETTKMAVYANQTVNLGSSFTPFFLLMCLADLCKVKINIKIQTVLIIWSGLIFFFASSVGVVDLYYKSVYIIQTHGVYMLKKIHGPIHFIFPLYLMTTMVWGYVIIIRSFFNRRKVSYKNSILLMFFMTIMIFVYAAEKLSRLNVPLVPFGYIVVQTGVIILLSRISMYDVASISSDVLVETSLTGIICFDSKGSFLGADEDAYNWFPETQKLEIDTMLESNETDFFVQIKSWIENKAENDSVLIERNGKFYRLEHSEKNENRFKSIHCIFIRDETEQQRYTKLIETLNRKLESYNENLDKEVKAKTQTLRKIQTDIIIGMASIVENRDNNTGGHIERTSEVVNIFVDHLMEQKIYPELPLNFWHNVVRAAPLHDFGKVGIPDTILNKPGLFTDDEYDIMKTHAEKGKAMVENMLRNSDDESFKEVAVNVAHYHHEKWNGEGYPGKISGEKIPFEARIMALADVFDALVSKRVYKNKFSYEKAFGIIAESSGSHFDPELCAQFLMCRPKLEELYNRYADEE